MVGVPNHEVLIASFQRHFLCSGSIYYMCMLCCTATEGVPLLSDGMECLKSHRPAKLGFSGELSVRMCERRVNDERLFKSFRLG